MSASVAMALVAGLLAVTAVVTLLRGARSEAQTYRHRIAATMLAAAAIILAAFAWSLHRWDGELAPAPAPVRTAQLAPIFAR